MAESSTSGVPNWPPKLNDDQITSLTGQAIDYALSHSITYRPLPSTTKGAKPPQDTTIHAPISLLPSPFPAHLFEQSQSLQPLYNDLYARITVDKEFLRKIIGGNVILVDEFQARLWQLWNKVEQEGIQQPLHLGLFRSDYLLHQEGNNSQPFTIKQVELNTISSSFGPLCSRVSELHRYLARSTKGFFGVSPELTVDKLPINRALETLAGGLAAGYRAYAERAKAEDAILLFVVQDGERNAFDQRLIEYQLLEQHGIVVRRASLAQLSKSASLKGDEKRLYLDNANSGKSEEVAVVYFRAGYGPGDYPTETEWDARLTLERSLAIKCPTIALQLAGAKKVQQVLSNPGIVEHFVKDSKKGRIWSDEEVQKLRASFMPMYSMGEEDGGEGIKIASDPKLAKEYVLKPQREGGGNNIYREDIVGALKDLEKQDAEQGKIQGSDGSDRNIKRREAYILMKMIEPPTNVGNYLVRYDAAKSSSGSAPQAVLAPHVISELGAFGSILFEAEQQSTRVIFEQSGGHLLRTKASESNEGGVAAGFSVIDSPVLI